MNPILVENDIDLSNPRYVIIEWSYPYIKFIDKYDNDKNKVYIKSVIKDNNI